MKTQWPHIIEASFENPITSWCLDEDGDLAMLTLPDNYHLPDQSVAFTQLFADTFFGDTNYPGVAPDEFAADMIDLARAQDNFLSTMLTNFCNGSEEFTISGTGSQSMPPTSTLV